MTKVHYINYFNTDKNFGKAINDAISLFPKKDWVCVRDLDAMFLRPDCGNLIQNIVERYKDTYSLIGCVTNRLAQPWQLYNMKFSDDSDIRNHIGIANELHNTYGTKVMPFGSVIAGCFMLFPIKVWAKCKFAENTPRFDFIFTDCVKAKGGKVGIAQGLYQFHLYRMWSENPIEEVAHLI